MYIFIQNSQLCLWFSFIHNTKITLIYALHVQNKEIRMIKIGKLTLFFALSSGFKVPAGGVWGLISIGADEDLLPRSVTSGVVVSCREAVEGEGRASVELAGLGNGRHVGRTGLGRGSDRSGSLEDSSKPPGTVLKLSLLIQGSARDTRVWPRLPTDCRRRSLSQVSLRRHLVCPPGAENKTMVSTVDLQINMSTLTLYFSKTFIVIYIPNYKVISKIIFSFYDQTCHKPFSMS